MKLWSGCIYKILEFSLLLTIGVKSKRMGVVAIRLTLETIMTFWISTGCVAFYCPDVAVLVFQRRALTNMTRGAVS